MSESKHNFKVFLWHATFLALASSFMDIDTVVPFMLIKVGGNAIHLGFLTTILYGGSSFSQLIFSSLLSNQAYKKKFLLIGVGLRVFSLFSLATMFYFAADIPKAIVLTGIFVFISLFAFSGSFSNVSYIDILGKTIDSQIRKRFFSLKQLISSVGLLSSAILAGLLLKKYQFPVNYTLLFLAAGSLLSLASLGFVALRETTPTQVIRRNFKDFFTQMPLEIKQNQNLKNYLWIINLLGIGVSLLPFVVLLAKSKMHLSVGSVGVFLIFRTLGMLSGSLSLFFLSKRFKYNKVLKINTFLGASLPVLALLLQDNSFLFPGIFFLAGIFVSTYKIAVDGILIEISSNHNRTLYAGMAGAGNILTAIFPIVAGFLIQSFGIPIVFTLITILMLSSFYFTNKLICK
jgi:MFS family permease